MAGIKPPPWMPSTFHGGGGYYPGMGHGGVPGPIYLHFGGGHGGQGGNGGGGNGGGGNGKGKKGGKNQSIKNLSLQELFSLGMNLAHPLQQTRHDIQTIYGPQVRGLKNDYQNYANQMGALYSVLGNQLADTGASADNNYQKVNNDYTQGTQDILGSLAQTTAPDQAAFLNVLGNQALAGSKDLAQTATNEQRYNASMGQQAGMENTILQRNAAGSLNDALESLRKQRASDFQSQLDQNRQTAFERMLALKQYQLQAAQSASMMKGDKWTRQFYQDMFGNAMPGGGGGRHGGGGHHGGNGNPGGSGNTNRPVGDQTQKLDMRNLVHRLLQGQTTFGQLNQNKKKGLRNANLNPYAATIASTYQNVVGSPNPQDSLLQLLRQLARAQANG